MVNTHCENSSRHHGMTDKFSNSRKNFSLNAHPTRKHRAIIFIDTRKCFARQIKRKASKQHLKYHTCRVQPKSNILRGNVPIRLVHSLSIGYIHVSIYPYIIYTYITRSSYHIFMLVYFYVFKCMGKRKLNFHP